VDNANGIPNLPAAREGKVALRPKKAVQTSRCDDERRARRFTEDACLRISRTDVNKRAGLKLDFPESVLVVTKANLVFRSPFELVKNHLGEPGLGASAKIGDAS
jgi:hypothetical protein